MPEFKQRITLDRSGHYTLTGTFHLKAHKGDELLMCIQGVEEEPYWYSVDIKYHCSDPEAGGDKDA